MAGACQKQVYVCMVIMCLMHNLDKLHKQTIGVKHKQKK